jgi:dUTP pyrophosphatase
VRPVIEVPVLRLDAALPAPAYARPGDAGIDLCAKDGTVLAPAGGRAVIGTGIALELPEGYAACVQPRSGLAARHGVTCLNAPGLIDSGYRGEISVVLVNTDPSVPYQVSRGDRIAQLVVYPVATVRLVEVEELAASARGGGGFGHTGR